MPRRQCGKARRSTSCGARCWPGPELPQPHVSTGRLARALEEAGKVLQLGNELADPLLIEMAEMVRGEILMYQGEEGAEEALSHARATAEACADRLNLAAIEALRPTSRSSLASLTLATRASRRRMPSWKPSGRARTRGTVPCWPKSRFGSGTRAPPGATSRPCSGDKSTASDFRRSRRSAPPLDWPGPRAS